MTEFKKWSIAYEELKKVNGALLTADPPQLGKAIALGEALIAENTPRSAKLLSKALEKNPDKQVFNEMMCERIKQLHGDFEAATAVFLERKGAAEDTYAAYLNELAVTQQYKDALLQSIGAIEERESEGRVMMRFSEQKERQELHSSREQGADAIRKAMTEREAAKWSAEFTRRTGEKAALMAWLDSFHGDRVAAFCAAVRSLVVRHPATVDNLRMLVKELVRHPENADIRKIRNNNANFVRDFGHPCSAVSRDRYYDVERALFAVGFGVTYVGDPTTVPSIADEECKPLGHEVYNDRWLILNEPDPSLDPSEWCSWHEATEKMALALEQRDYEGHASH